MPGKVLIITYYWPPSGGAGVQRWLKFTKYLPSTGWTPVILTVSPDYAAYPFRDASLYGEIPLDVEIHRTKAINYFSLYSKDPAKIPSAGFAKGSGRGLKERLSRFIRGNFFIPDPRKGWNKYAFRKACSLIRSDNISHVITSSPPHSTQLIGLKLKRRFPHIRWVADIRDPWTDIYYYDMFNPSFLARKVDMALEKNVLTRSDIIITVGHSLASLFSQKAENISPKIHVLPNGYDEEDFEGASPVQPEVFTITYVGTLSPSYPLGSLIAALRELGSGGLKVNLRFVGTIQEPVRQMIESENSFFSSEFIPYSEHPEAIRYMMSSSMLLLVIPDHPSGKSIITGKLFEYIAAGKPILLIGPKDGDAAQILSRHRNAGVFAYDETMAIAKFVLSIASGEIKPLTGIHAEYSRRVLTNSLSNILHTLGT